jgi:thiaminase/transcriptional activator TenA
VERTLHDSFMQEFDISKQEFENTPLTLPAIITPLI